MHFNNFYVGSCRLLEESTNAAAKSKSRALFSTLRALKDTIKPLILPFRGPGPPQRLSFIPPTRSIHTFIYPSIVPPLSPPSLHL